MRGRGRPNALKKCRFLGFGTILAIFFGAWGGFSGLISAGAVFGGAKKIDRQRAFLRAGGGVFCKNRGFPLFFVCEGVNFLHIV